MSVLYKQYIAKKIKAESQELMDEDPFANAVRMKTYPFLRGIRQEEMSKISGPYKKAARVLKEGGKRKPLKGGRNPGGLRIMSESDESAELIIPPPDTRTDFERQRPRTRKAKIYQKKNTNEPVIFFYGV